MISKWETLSKTASKERAEHWTSLPAEGFLALRDAWSRHEIDDCPSTYYNLRTRLVEAYDSVCEEVANSETKSKNMIYQKEFRFALKVFSILNEEGMTVRTASDDGVWRFLSMIVFPDIVYDRWKKPNDSRYINADRFYLKTRRIWLKMLWWYIYLCWQGSLEKTAELIATNKADEISQLVERAGTGGYRVDLFREIIRYYDTNISAEKRTEEDNLLSRVLALNVVRNSIIDPDLVPGGVAVYVKQLFEYFGY